MSDMVFPHPFDRLDRQDQLHQTLMSGETLFFQDGETAGLFFLVSGSIDLKRTTSTGHSILIHRARAGDTFAEASLFAKHYHCTAVCIDKTHVVEFRRSTIITLLDSDLEFSRAMASRFAVQIQQSRRRVELLSIRASEERILEALADGLLTDDISSFADLIGLAPETVYRTLTKLSRSGRIMKTARGRYQLLSAEKRS